jgi:hypothetical protein
VRVAAVLLPASMLRAVAAGLGAIAVSCTPRDDLSAYSAGRQATAAHPLDPVGPGPALAPGTGNLVPAATPPAAPEDEAAGPETAEATNSEAPPTDLVSGGDPGGGESSATGNPRARGGAGGDVSDEGAAPAMPPSAASRDSPPAAPPATPPPSFRFVRLVADSDVTGGPLTSIAEFDVLGADGQPLDRRSWIATADSAEPTYVGGAPAPLAIDGQPGTMWHTPWFQVVPPPHPHFLQVDMGQAHTLSGFRYLARQDGALDGRVAAYRFFVSADGVDWGQPRAAGTLANSDQPQVVSVP